jgi:uncharacterized lipoprotein YajG
MKHLLFAIVVVGIALQTGCVTGQRSFPLAIPTQGNPPPTQGMVYIAAVTDDRAFQNKPSDPSTPSIDGDVTKLSAQKKDRMIGRQRNGFGKAMGDIALPLDESVTERTRLLVAQGLARKGYQVSTDANAANLVSVSVKEFWAWSTPGFWALTFEAKLSCEITVKNSSGLHTATVKGDGLNHGQVAKNANWKEAYDPAFEEFISDFDTQWDNLVPRGDKGGGDLYERLKKLDELRKAGILSQQEFEAQKTKLLAQ